MRQMPIPMLPAIVVRPIADVKGSLLQPLTGGGTASERNHVASAMRMGAWLHLSCRKRHLTDFQLCAIMGQEAGFV